MIRETRTQVLLETKDRLSRRTTYLQEGWWCTNEDCLEEWIQEEDWNNKNAALNELRKQPWTKEVLENE